MCDLFNVADHLLLYISSAFEYTSNKGLPLILKGFEYLMSDITLTFYSPKKTVVYQQKM